MSQHGQPQSSHFSQSQHKTPKRDTLSLLVPCGTRWQGKREDIRGSGVSAFSPLTLKPHGSDKTSKSSSGVPVAPKTL